MEKPIFKMERDASMLKIKTLKRCGNLPKVSNEVKQYVKNTIVRSH